MSLDLDAIRARADAAHRWLIRDPNRFGGQPASIPPSDIYALLAEIDHLNAAYVPAADYDGEQVWQDDKGRVQFLAADDDGTGVPGWVRLYRRVTP